MSTGKSWRKCLQESGFDYVAKHKDKMLATVKFVIKIRFP